MDLAHLNGLILVGGKSQRMQKDKANLTYHDLPQAQHAYNLLKPFCNETFFSLRKDQASNEIFKNYPQIIDDDQYKNRGPLTGILSAFSINSNSAWIIIACDLPHLTAQTLKKLIAHRNPFKKATVYQSEHDQLPEPLCAIYEPTFLPTLNSSFDSGLKCPRKILINENQDISMLKLDNPKALNNINTPEEFNTVIKDMKLKK